MNELGTDPGGSWLQSGNLLTCPGCAPPSSLVTRQEFNRTQDPLVRSGHTRVPPTVSCAHHHGERPLKIAVTMTLKTVCNFLILRVFIVSMVPVFQCFLYFVGSFASFPSYDPHHCGQVSTDTSGPTLGARGPSCSLFNSQILGFLLRARWSARPSD